MSTMLQVCVTMGIPVATEKCEGPATCITFLGIVLDSSLQQLRLPPDKLQEISSLTMSWLGKRIATKRELLSLIGKLSFAAKPEPTYNGGTASYHLGMASLCSSRQSAESFQLYTDASGSFGFGAYLDGAWFRGDWRPHQQLPKRSIQWQELFAIVAAARTWGHFLVGQRIRFHCDNLPLVQAWTNQFSKQPGVMELLRMLFFIAARNSFTVSLVHLPGKQNCIADALSRNQMSRFFSLAPQANQLPTELAEL
ncbi:hypothetical protein EMCRGX_G027230 [Ephydatia muelleri]